MASARGALACRGIHINEASSGWQVNFCFACGELVIQHSLSGDQEQHPPLYDRIYNNLEKFVADSGHPAWALASTILRSTMEARKMKYDELRLSSGFKKRRSLLLRRFQRLSSQEEIRGNLAE